MMVLEWLCEDSTDHPCPAHPEERKARVKQKGKFALQCQYGTWPGCRELKRNILKTRFWVFKNLFGFYSFFLKINSSEITVFICQFSVFKKALK